MKRVGLHAPTAVLPPPPALQPSLRSSLVVAMQSKISTAARVAAASRSAAIVRPNVAPPCSPHTPLNGEIHEAFMHRPVRDVIAAMGRRADKIAARKVRAPHQLTGFARWYHNCASCWLKGLYPGDAEN